MEGDPLPCIDAIQVYSEGVADLLSNINPSKSHGPDNLPACLLKRSALRLLLPYINFLGIVRSGYFSRGLEAGHSCSHF